MFHSMTSRTWMSYVSDDYRYVHLGLGTRLLSTRELHTRTRVPKDAAVVFYK